MQSVGRQKGQWVCVRLVRRQWISVLSAGRRKEDRARVLSVETHKGRQTTGALSLGRQKNSNSEWVGGSDSLPFPDITVLTGFRVALSQPHRWHRLLFFYSLSLIFLISFLSEGEEEGGSWGGGILCCHSWEFPTGNTGLWSPEMLSAAKRRYWTWSLCTKTQQPSRDILPFAPHRQKLHRRSLRHHSVIVNFWIHWLHQRQDCCHLPIFYAAF